ncbi:MAG: hypothetical protein ACRDPC_29000 [Solirubrobacteraceae bacterium]
MITGLAPAAGGHPPCVTRMTGAVRRMTPAAQPAGAREAALDLAERLIACSPHEAVSSEDTPAPVATGRA